VVVTLRNDGRWQVRGDVIDLRKCSFVPMVADIQPAGIIHSMAIDLCFAPEQRRIDSIEVRQPVVAIEPSEQSRGESCRDPAPRLQAFAGQTLDDEFASRLSAGFRGPLGCTHLLTLFQLMASTLRRAATREEQLLARLGTSRAAGERLFRRSVFVDGSELEDGSIGMAIQLGDFHTRPGPVVEWTLDRLEEQVDLRAYARVDMPNRGLSDLQAGQRERQGRAFMDAPWRNWSSRLSPFEDAPLMGGFAARLIAELGEDPEAELLLDTLLQLAPGFIQVVAAITERWFAPATTGGKRTPRPASGSATTLPIGGMRDSCYMWRTDSALQQARDAQLRSHEKGD